MRFRILVIGRANSGKTTILQRVCNSTHKPRIFDGKGNMVHSYSVLTFFERGYHDIEQELVFQSNPAFVFHDSCGFEAGSAQEFDQMKAFVADRAAARNMNERLHAIWFCIPMTDSHRLVTLAEQKFFNECDTRHVPVIVVLTKVDALYLTAMRMLLDGGSAISEARERAITMQGALLEKFLGNLKHVLHMCKFPPKEYVVLHKMHQPDGDCTALMQCTAHALNEEGLWISPMLTKQTSIAMSIQHAVYW
ncbi:GTP-binding protein [Pisolithus marmoratus]|nr:GTP-binding protein [Pisolithus marmoratus]